MAANGVDFVTKDGIAEIILNRAPANIVGHAMIDGILAALRTAGEDPDVLAVVFTSALERTFSGGLDLDLVRGATSAQFRTFLEKIYIQLFDVQYRLGKPTISALNGAARGAGVTLAMSCDMVIASDTASIGYSEINVGLLPGIHFTLLPQQIGRYQAFELLFLGKSISAADAHRIGLINRIVSPSQLRETAFGIAREFASKPPGVMKIARDTFMRTTDLDRRRSIESAVDTLCSLIESPETQEGLSAFLEKRSPRW